MGDEERLTVIVRHAIPGDAPVWLAMRQALWPEADQAEHAEEVERFFRGEAREPAAVLLADDGDGRAVGFAELSIRPYAEGCHTDRVAYLEGWWVAPGERRRGVGRALVEGAMAWGRTQGCTEFASDADADNEASAAAHARLGFEEVGLIRCFRRDPVTGPPPAETSRGAPP
jgi:aminoglycoside 6'-N-acetyltransferase I